ncbi:GntR family transcriptional regulator [Pararoseomonas indoligenes]|uniref:GntR family transcriptional regulator n=1 Tax=Roseomonas indoligenes TaxID=2820811 RepID=A0A940S944_9PROT|nr:GntR family transcriptional regulator [Pararoseomonas indoligenes]MBP0494863.1 GntR family transcriptional regulator [Pararoseomonas indoligenes]
MSATVEPFKARRVYLVLRDRIGCGALPPGARLPGEPDLAAEHGVARVTIRRALDQLAREGLLERRPGVGTFVRGVATLPPATADFADVFTHLKEMGRRTEVRLLSFGYAVPPPAVALALDLAPGEAAQRAVRVRCMASGPFSYLTTHVPARIGRTYSESELASQPLLVLLERSGLRIGRARQSIGATLAGPDLAAVLEVEIGAPLIALTRLVQDEEGRAVEHLHALYRPDRFSFELQMQRTGAEGERRWSPMAPTGASPANVNRTRSTRTGRGPDPQDDERTGS